METFGTESCVRGYNNTNSSGKQPLERSWSVSASTGMQPTLIASAIAWVSIVELNNPLGLGRPPTGFVQRSRAVLHCLRHLNETDL